MNPRFILWHTLVPIVLGTIIAVAVLGIRELAAFVWLGLLVVAFRRYRRNEQRTRALFAVAWEVLIVSGIVAFAIAAPGKTRDKVLERPVKLAKTDITLAELKELAEESPNWRESFPTHVSIWLRGVDASTHVHFRGRVMNLQEFVSAIESQTPLRHRFHSCGNGHTIIEGEDCSFGMSLRDPTK